MLRKMVEVAASVAVAGAIVALGGNTAGASEPGAPQLKQPQSCDTEYLTDQGLDVGATAYCIGGTGQFRVKVTCEADDTSINDYYGDWVTVTWYPRFSSQYCPPGSYAIDKHYLWR